MKILVVWFGRPAASPYEAEIERYRRAVAHRWPAEDRPLRPAAGGRQSDPERALEREAAAIERQLIDGWWLVVLDEGGLELASAELSGLLADAERAAVPGVTFIVGSDLGVAAGVRQRARHCLSLGRVTLPHLLARLVLWEQLYRATDILGGGRYHRLRVQ